MHKIFVLQQVYFMPLHVSSTCAHHQEVKIALHSLWYHQTYRCNFDLLMMSTQYSKHVEAWSKLTVKNVHQVVNYWDKYIPLLCVQWKKFLMMDRGTVRNVKFNPKINLISSASSWFYCKKIFWIFVVKCGLIKNINWSVLRLSTFTIDVFHNVIYG